MTVSLDTVQVLPAPHPTLRAGASIISRSHGRYVLDGTLSVVVVRGGVTEGGGTDGVLGSKTMWPYQCYCWLAGHVSLNNYPSSPFSLYKSVDFEYRCPCSLMWSVIKNVQFSYENNGGCTWITSSFFSILAPSWGGTPSWGVWQCHRQGYFYWLFE